MNKKLTKSGVLGTALLAGVLLFGNAGNAFAATTFTRDLTLGSNGSDVIALQAMLIGQGFSIPAGATGYFGGQTKAALASYQAAHSIVPAAGYFGAITRASVNASTDTSTGNTNTGGTNDNTGSGSVLSGGEATLRSFDLTAGNDLSEGDSNQEIASAKFDVKGGDIRVQRVTLELTAQNNSLSTQPWRYLDTLSMYNGSKKVGSVDVSSKNDWDKSGNTYSVDVPVDTIVKSGKSVELSIHADAQGSIDSANQDQTFSVVIPTNGIRAVDAKGIQQYTGKDSDSVTLGFNGEDNGKLTLRTSSDNPDAGVIVADTSKTSDKTDVLAFEIKNSNDADVDLNEMTFRVDGTFANGSVSGEDVQNIIRKATLKLDGKTYNGTISGTDSGSYEGAITFKNLTTTVDGNDSVDGVLTVELFGSSNHYDAGATLSFDLLSADVDAEGDRSGDAAEVNGTVSGNLMTISTDAGINVANRSNTAVLTYNSNNTASSFAVYTLKFDVTATGDDVYVPRTVLVDGDASTTAGARVITMGDAFTGTETASITSTAKTYNADYYVVNEGDTKTFTVNVVLDPDTAGYYQVGLDFVQFSAVSSDFNSLQKLDVDQNKSQFRTDPIYIPG